MSSRFEVRDLELPGAGGGVGPRLNVENLRDKMVLFPNLPDGTFQVQVSNDGSEWQAHGSTVSGTGGVVVIDFACRFVRAQATVNPTGTHGPAQLSGLIERD